MKSKKGGMGITQSQVISLVIVGLMLSLLFQIVSATLNPNEVQQQFLMKDAAYLIDALLAVPHVVEVFYSSPSKNSFVSLSSSKLKVSSFSEDGDSFERGETSQDALDALKDLYSIYTKSFTSTTGVAVKPVAYLDGRSFSFLKTSESIVSKNGSFEASFIDEVLDKEKILEKKNNLYVDVVVDSSENLLMKSTLDQLANTIDAQLIEEGFNQEDATSKVVLRLSFLSKDSQLPYKTQLFYSTNNKEFTHQTAKTLATYLQPRIVLLAVPQKMQETQTAPTIEIAFANSEYASISSKLLEQTDEYKGFKQSMSLYVVAALEEVVA